MSVPFSDYAQIIEFIAYHLINLCPLQNLLCPSLLVLTLETWIFSSWPISSQVCSYLPFKALPFGFRWQALAFPSWVHWLPLYPLCFLSLPYLQLTDSLLPTLRVRAEVTNLRSLFYSGAKHFPLRTAPHCYSTLLTFYSHALLLRIPSTVVFLKILTCELLNNTAMCCLAPTGFC